MCCGDALGFVCLVLWFVYVVGRSGVGTTTQVA